MKKVSEKFDRFTAILSCNASHSAHWQETFKQAKQVQSTRKA